MRSNKNNTMELTNSTFFLVGNIPKSFRSSNLRVYFSNFVEKGIFSCFHYKHRPEHLRLLNTSSEAEATPSTSKETKSGHPTSKCCVIAVKTEFSGDFLKTHQNKNWSQEDGSLLAAKVHINKLDISLPSTAGESGEIHRWGELIHGLMDLSLGGGIGFAFINTVLNVNSEVYTVVYPLPNVISTSCRCEHQ